ncbi:hypothetical protein ACPA9J_15650 [Pseudomonas aeruginosa]
MRLRQFERICEEVAARRHRWWLDRAGHSLLCQALGGSTEVRPGQGRGA